MHPTPIIEKPRFEWKMATFYLETKSLYKLYNI